jgi:hypothetical protein
MIKKYYIFLILFTILTTNAMETDDNITCYLAMLPIETRNYIASYLLFNSESDEEFIERSIKSEIICDDHMLLVKSYEQPEDSSFSLDWKLLVVTDTLRTYSVDYTKIIILEKLKDHPKVTVFDLQSETGKESQRLAQLSEENMGNILHIAFSRKGNFYAQLQRHYSVEEEGVSMKTCFIIKDVFSNKTQHFPVPFYYSGFISIGFNKQDTKIIVHAQENDMEKKVISEKEPKRWYHIIPLTSPEEHEAKSKRTLEMFLLQYGCCNNLLNSL